MKLPSLPHLSFSGTVITAGVLTTISAPAQRVGGQWTLEAELYGTEHKGFFGTAVAGPGDLDFDGYADLLIGAPREIRNQGMVYAYSGRTHAPLWTWTYLGVCRTGTSVDGAGDLNGDGRPDVVVGAPETQASLCSVVALLHDGTVWWAVQSLEDLGISVAGAGDVNLDGFDDVIAGESEISPGGRITAGSAFVYSGRDGSLLHEFAGSGSSEYFGTPAAGAGDLDGDGHDDLLIGATGSSFAGLNSGSVYAYSGRTGGLLYRLDGTQPNDLFGTALASLEDVDLDGTPDFTVAALEEGVGVGRVEIRSGADGALLEVIPGFGPDFAYGWSVAAVGDADGDRLPDLLVGAKNFHPTGGYSDAGAAFLYSFDPFVFADATTLGGIQVPLGTGPLLSAMLGGQAPPNVQGAYGTLDANARASAGITTHPLLAAQIGRTFSMAALSYDAATLTGRRSSIAWPITVIL